MNKKENTHHQLINQSIPNSYCNIPIGPGSLLFLQFIYIYNSCLLPIRISTILIDVKVLAYSVPYSLSAANTDDIHIHTVHKVIPFYGSLPPILKTIVLMYEWLLSCFLQ